MIWKKHKHKNINIKYKSTAYDFKITKSKHTHTPDNKRRKKSNGLFLLWIPLRYCRKVRLKCKRYIGGNTNGWISTYLCDTRVNDKLQMQFEIEDIPNHIRGTKGGEGGGGVLEQDRSDHRDASRKGVGSPITGSKSKKPRVPTDCFGTNIFKQTYTVFSNGYQHTHPLTHIAWIFLTYAIDIYYELVLYQLGWNLTTWKHQYNTNPNR